MVCQIFFEGVRMAKSGSDRAPRALKAVVVAKAVAASAEPAPARRGRRPRSADASAGGGLSRALIVEHAMRLVQEESVSELSIVRLARELGVTPGLVHYFVGSRDELISGIMNVAFRERVEALPPPSGQWRTDLEAVAAASFRVMQRWKGIATYTVTHNRFRLFQKVLPGERDWGLAYFDHVGEILRRGGFTPGQAAMAYHLFMLFLVSIGNEIANRQTPAEHRDFVMGYVMPRADAYPGAAFLVDAFTQVRSEATLQAGLQALLDGFEGWLLESQHRRAAAVRPPQGRRASSRRE